jgi:hypothetical protein
MPNQSEGSEENKKDWGYELTALVSANESIVVKCAWMGGAEVTVGEAMSNYNFPPNLTAEDEPYLISVVLDLLNNRVTEIEVTEVDKPEDDQEEEPQEDKTVKQVKDEKIKTKSETVEPTLNEEKNPEPSIRETVKPVQAESPVPETRKYHVPPSQAPIKAETNLTNSETTAQIVRVTETLAPAPDVLTTEAASVIEIEAPSNAEESHPVPVLVEADSGPQIGDPTPDVDSMDERPTETELSMVRANTLVIEDKTIDMDTRLPVEEQLFDEGYLLPAIETGIDVVEETDIPEDPVLSPIDSSAADVGEEFVLQIHHDKPLPKLLSETIPVERLGAAESNAERIEDTILQIVEKVEISTPELIETVDKVLQKIQAVTADLEALDDAQPSETGIQEELEALFTELLESLGIEYEPGTAETLSRMVIMRYLAGEIAKPGHLEADELLQDPGTHEIITKMLTGLSSIKKAMAQAGAIGQLATRLYNLSPAQ